MNPRRFLLVLCALLAALMVLSACTDTIDPVQDQSAQPGSEPTPQAEPSAQERSQTALDSPQPELAQQQVEQDASASATDDSIANPRMEGVTADDVFYTALEDWAYVNVVASGSGISFGIGCDGQYPSAWIDFLPATINHPYPAVDISIDGTPLDAMIWTSSKTGLLRSIYLETLLDRLELWRQLERARHLEASIRDDDGQRLRYRFDVAGIFNTPIQSRLDECRTDPAADSQTVQRERATPVVGAIGTIEYSRNSGLSAVWTTTEDIDNQVPYAQIEFGLYCDQDELVAWPGPVPRRLSGTVSVRWSVDGVEQQELQWKARESKSLHAELRHDTHELMNAMRGATEASFSIGPPDEPFTVSFPVAGLLETPIQPDLDRCE